MSKVAAAMGSVVEECWEIRYRITVSRVG